MNTPPMNFWLPPVFRAFSGMWHEYYLTEASHDVVTAKTGILHMSTPSPPPQFFRTEPRTITMSPLICLEMSSFDFSDEYSRNKVHGSNLFEQGVFMVSEIHLVSSSSTLIAEAFAMRLALCMALTLEFPTLEVLSNL